MALGQVIVRLFIYFFFFLSDSAGASVVDQDECQKALDNLLNSFQDVIDLQAKVGLIFLVMLCN